MVGLITLTKLAAIIIRMMLTMLRSEYLMLGNLTCGYNKPCVLDLKVKMGIFFKNIIQILTIGGHSDVWGLCKSRKTKKSRE